jgi:carboxypeptidase T
MKRQSVGLLVLSSFLFLRAPTAKEFDLSQHIFKVTAQNKFERSLIANAGVSIEVVKGDQVTAIGTGAAVQKLKNLGFVVTELSPVEALDFPVEDQRFHNYTELKTALVNLSRSYPQQTELQVIGRSGEGRDILALKISANRNSAESLPGILYVGGHHAREHLSVEIPLMLAEDLLAKYAANDSRVRSLLETRDITIIPNLNPDGSEYDISTGSYKVWRKNRRANARRTFGVDLNRNYDFAWGTGGSSTNPSDETYMGTAAFSEPETVAIKNYVEAHPNIKVMLSYHTYSELILYPWGHTYDPIAQAQDKKIFENMANTMSRWNGYTPQQSSELYIASGDLTDWAYGAHKIFAFTFELDPQGGFGSGGGGFYPGAAVIDEVYKKNFEPALYLLQMAGDPTRAL